jgi:hypothetical protein
MIKLVAKDVEGEVVPDRCHFLPEERPFNPVLWFIRVAGGFGGRDLSGQTGAEWLSDSVILPRIHVPPI